MALVKSDRGIGYFPSYIKYRIQCNKNFLCCITGGTGSGKSYSALRLAETLDPNFDIGNVCFHPKEFVNLVQGKTKKLKKGSVILWDELQVKMSNLDYQSVQAKCINFVLQTFRYKGFVLIVTSPHFSFINAGARKLFHSRIETISINKNTNQCTLKPFLLQVNQDKGDIYRKYLRVKTTKGIVPVERLKLGLANKELLKKYEEKKDTFTGELYEEISQDLDALEGTDRKRPPTEKQKQILNLLLEGMKVPEIAKELDVHMNMIYTQMKYIQKKGIQITPEKEGARIIRYNVEGYDI